jgi:hypothetical protein
MRQTFEYLVASKSLLWRSDMGGSIELMANANASKIENMT